ncbi:peptidoglycan-binding domain-containing protein [Kiloniella litopenaei]|uniref:peptidoglycan-binding domain-containing protein n=1 Tax=Kiloniella litopenaei TaxID=1549748 RepID=UPI003BA8516D
MSDDKLKSEDEKPTSRKSRQPTTRKTAAKKSSAKAKPEEKNTSTTTKKAAAKKAAPKKVVSKASTAPTSSSGEKLAKDKSTGESKKTGPVAKTVTAKTKKVVDKSKSEPVGDDTKKAPQGKKADKEAKTAKHENRLNESKEKTKSPTVPPKDAISRPKKGYSLSKMITVAAVLFLGVLAVFLVGKDSLLTKSENEPQQSATQATDEPNPNASSPYGMRVEQLKEIEGLLASLNFDPGRIDGDIDHEAVAAISLFQEISGLQVDGKPTPDLLAELKAVDEMLSNN